MSRAPAGPLLVAAFLALSPLLACMPSGQTFVTPHPTLERMRVQKRADFLDPSDFFTDGAVAQPPPAGAQRWDPAAPRQEPPRVTRALLDRGRAAFDIYCAACHGVDGTGDTPVAERMDLVRPRDLHIERLRAANARDIHAVVTGGYGLMTSYAWALTDDDAWAVAYYVKALQKSRRVDLATLSPALRATLAAGKAPPTAAPVGFSPTTSFAPATATPRALPAPPTAAAPPPAPARTVALDVPQPVVTSSPWRAGLIAFTGFALAVGAGALFLALLADVVRARWLERLRPACVAMSAIWFGVPVLAWLAGVDHAWWSLLLVGPALAARWRGGEARAALTIIAVIVLGSSAAFAWLPAEHSSSTIFGVLVLAGGVAAALGLAVAGDDAGPDGATMLFAFVAVFTYFAFSQLIVEYAADLPAEAGFYALRRHSLWGVMAAVVAGAGVVAPLSLLGFRVVKGARRARAVLGVTVAAAQAVYVAWIALPPRVAPAGAAAAVATITALATSAVFVAAIVALLLWRARRR